MEVSINVKESYIYIKISQQILLDPAGWEKIESVRADVVDTIKKTGIYVLLFDCRELSGKLSIIDRFLLAAILVKENMKFVITQAPNIKIAFVLNQSLMDAEKFGEKVARNRGLRGLVTDNIQEAFKWLGLDAAFAEVL